MANKKLTLLRWGLAYTSLIDLAPTLRYRGCMIEVGHVQDIVRTQICIKKR